MRRALLVLTVTLGLAGCGSGTGGGRVIVLGLDGMDPQVVDLLMSEGKMPNFATLRRDGAYGKLQSSPPLLSPIIWTTIATGKTPADHGIGHFTAVNEKTGEELPVTSRMRKVKAIWNIASEVNKKVGVVGWWATWPAEAVNGAMVSDHTCYHFLFTEGAKGDPGKDGLTFPPALENEIRPLIRRPSDMGPDDVAPFVQVPASDLTKPFKFEDDLSHFRWALATARSYRDIGLDLWKKEKPDLLMAYIEATDSTAHLFGHLFRATGLAGELAAQQVRYGGAVEAMYRYADEIVGQYMAALDDDTTLVVLSDHGFELGALPDDPSKTRDMRRVSEKYHRIDGILYLYGNRVRARHRIDRPTLVDITPTVLALLGVSPGRDMPGRVLSDGLDMVEPPPRTVASWETGERVAAADGKTDPGVDPAIVDRLKSLGYLDAHSPKGDRNMAAIHFEAGRYEEAAKAYQALVKEKPDDGSLRASLAGTLGALGRYDEALVQLNEAVKLTPLNPEGYHNRGVIYERQGKTEQAVKEYRTAVRYSPQYEPSRRALVRLTGSADVSGPRTEAERRAAQLADEASRAARRGDYGAAMRSLDEAEKAAPKFALVYQYRANVAFLAGDRAGAKKALERALALEPDNALYKQNLRELEKPSAKAGAAR
jgi:predicted AlkP superfamily phosphohydrolase/phosphomutase/Flp pilus assembly protein TadD